MKRRLSKEARARISTAQKARWAKYHKQREDRRNGGASFVSLSRKVLVEQHHQPAKKVETHEGKVTILSQGDGLELDVFTIKNWAELIDRIYRKYGGRSIFTVNVDCR